MVFLCKEHTRTISLFLLSALLLYPGHGREQHGPALGEHGGSPDWGMLEAASEKEKSYPESTEYTQPDKRNVDEMEIAKVQISLVRSWRELDRMLYCTKISRCVKAYQKMVRVGKEESKANLLQSIGITLSKIKQLTGMLKEIKR